MKRLFMSIAFLFVCIFQVQAADTGEIIRAFPYEQSLYAYISLDIDIPITAANGSLDGTQLGLESSLYTVQQAGSPVEYLLFIDNSGSISDYAQDILDFAQALGDLSGDATCFTIATFGDEFVLLAEEISAQEIVDVIASIKYNAYTTQLYTGMQEAIDYFEGKPRTGGELRGMIVLSDAIETADRLVLDNVQASDVMLHLVGFGDDEVALSELGTFVENTGGIHQVLGDDLTAIQGAETLHSALSQLYVLQYSLANVTATTEISQLSITFSSEGQLVTKLVGEVDLSQLDLDQEPTQVVVPTPQEVTPTPTQQDEAPTQSEAPSVEPVSVVETATSSSQAFLVSAIVAGCVLILVLVVVLIKSVKSKK